MALLRAWLAEAPVTTYGAFADLLGVHPKLVYQWIGPAPAVRCRPGLDHARRIEILTLGAVPMSAWADVGARVDAEAIVAVARDRVAKGPRGTRDARISAMSECAVAKIGLRPITGGSAT